MESKFTVERGSRSTTQEARQVSPALEEKSSWRSWQFVSDFQGVMGEDSEPDPLYFVETWTLGAAAAAENFKQRRLGQPNRPCRTSRFRESDRLGSQVFVAENGELLSSVHISGGPLEPQDRFDAQGQSTDPEPWESLGEESDWSLETALPMTRERACKLLGVTATSTRGQIKAAYRRMVSQWHPDLLECRTEEVRQRATEKMAAINEAYHLLRNGL